MAISPSFFHLPSHGQPELLLPPACQRVAQALINEVRYMSSHSFLPLQTNKAILLARTIFASAGLEERYSKTEIRKHCGFHPTKEDPLLLRRKKGERITLTQKRKLTLLIEDLNDILSLPYLPVPRPIIYDRLPRSTDHSRFRCWEYAISHFGSLSKRCSRKLPVWGRPFECMRALQFKQVETAQNGDLVCYIGWHEMVLPYDEVERFEAKHWGIFLDGLVRSKWGSEHVYVHELDDVAPVYGSHVFFFRYQGNESMRRIGPTREARRATFHKEVASKRRAARAFGDDLELPAAKRPRR